jgi:hypothetical protein
MTHRWIFTSGWRAQKTDWSFLKAFCKVHDTKTFLTNFSEIMLCLLMVPCVTGSYKDGHTSDHQRHAAIKSIWARESLNSFPQAHYGLWTVSNYMMSNSSLLLRLAGLSSNRKFQRIIVQELEKSKDYIDQKFWFGKNLRQFQGRTSVRQPWKERSCHKIESLCAPYHIARQLECALNVSPICF